MRRIFLPVGFEKGFIVDQGELAVDSLGELLIGFEPVHAADISAQIAQRRLAPLGEERASRNHRADIFFQSQLGEIDQFAHAHLLGFDMERKTHALGKDFPGGHRRQPFGPAAAH